MVRGLKSPSPHCFLANVLLSLMLMAACALSGITGVPPGRIVELFTLSSDISIFITHPWTLATYMVVQLSFLHFAFQHAVALLVREVFP